MSELKTINKITDGEIKKTGVQSLADRPNRNGPYGTGGLSATQLKEAFDALAKLIAERFNHLVTELGSDSAADYIRVTLGEYQTLGDVLRAIKSGKLAQDLMVKPTASATDAKKLQDVINGIAQNIAYEIEARKNINDLLGDKLPDETKAETVIGYIGEVEKKVDSNASAINTLNGDASKEGSVRRQIAEAIAAIMENPDTSINSIKELVDWVNDHASDALELSNNVSANQKDISDIKAAAVGKPTLSGRRLVFKNLNGDTFTIDLPEGSSADFTKWTTKLSQELLGTEGLESYNSEVPPTSEAVIEYVKSTGPQIIQLNKPQSDITLRSPDVTVVQLISNYHYDYCTGKYGAVVAIYPPSDYPGFFAGYSLKVTGHDENTKARVDTYSNPNTDETSYNLWIEFENYGVVTITIDSENYKILISSNEYYH